MTIENGKFKCDQCWRTTDICANVSDWDIGLTDICPSCLGAVRGLPRWLCITILIAVAVVVVWGLFGMRGVRS